jgi:hypothetical protein
VRYFAVKNVIFGDFRQFHLKKCNKFEFLAVFGAHLKIENYEISG